MKVRHSVADPSSDKQRGMQQTEQLYNIKHRAKYRDFLENKIEFLPLSLRPNSTYK